MSQFAHLYTQVANSRLACVSFRTLLGLHMGSVLCMCWIKDGEGNTGDTHKRKKNCGFLQEGDFKWAAHGRTWT